MSDLKRFRAGYLEWRDSEDGDEDNVIAYTEALEARVAELEERDRERVYQILNMQRSLETKNRALDALHYVWCDGGCPHGMHRWSENEVTEEIVLAAERNTTRLRAWWKNAQARAAIAAEKGETP